MTDEEYEEYWRSLSEEDREEEWWMMAEYANTED